MLPLVLTNPIVGMDGVRQKTEPNELTDLQVRGGETLLRYTFRGLGSLGHVEMGQPEQVFAVFSCLLIFET